MKPTANDGETVPETEITSRRAQLLTLPVVLTGVLLVALSISGTALALPDIGNDLNASGAALNWVVAGYNLAFAGTTLVAGATADRFGRRRVFFFAAVVFSGGFLVTAAAPSIVVIDIARIASGVGGAGLMAAGGGLLAANYHDRERTRAFAYMGTMAGVGIAIGPTIVGALVALTGWRGSFIVFAALGVLVAVGSLRLSESQAQRANSDWLGAALFVPALSALMFAILEAPERGWGHPAVLLSFALSFVCFVLFGIAQRRSSFPILAADLVREPRYMAWCLATVTTSVGFLGILVFLPTYLRAVAEQSPATAGVTMLLLTAPVLFAPITAATIVNRGVSPRVLIVAALAFVVTGNFGLLLLRPENTVPLIIVPLLIIGTGMGISFGITDGQAMTFVPPHLVGTAAGFLNTLRGAAEAVVIAGFSAALLGVISSELGASGGASRVAAGRLSSEAADVRMNEIDALTTSWHVTQLGVGLICLVLSVVIVVLLFRPNRQLNTESPTASRESA
ncbi:MFS transporter [Brevibacterium casei]|uniref:MFS transporter n=1 Tax=Brevibacterium casei TaxID=33889 RepID=A0A7T4DII0_9MICO|nr:MFS transporter [Brevibacterium casei]QQB14360.1 MFS transporter [Brevibacterium casei]